MQTSIKEPTQPMHTDTDLPAARRRQAREPVPRPGYQGPTYYGRPTVKRSKYGALVWGYTYVAGLAGSAQILSTLADRFGSARWRSVVRNGRMLALAGPSIGSVLLIADLHTPQRWYNMLRIFRKTSPMSIGSYILTSFGFASGVTAIADLLARMPGLRWLRPLASVAQVPAAVTGAGMSTYTGALLSATSTPAWAAAPRLLTARFACGAMATAAAALSLGERLWGDERNSETLDKVALVATLADTVLDSMASRRYEAAGVADSLQGENTVAAEHRLTTAVEHVLPLACYGINALLPKQSRTLSAAAALGVLAGGLLMRSAIFHAGNRSAGRAEDYLAMTQTAPPGGRLH